MKGPLLNITPPRGASLRSMGHICESNIDPELSVMGKLLILTDIREKLIFAFYKHLILISGAVNESRTPAWGR